MSYSITTERSEDSQPKKQIKMRIFFLRNAEKKLFFPQFFFFFLPTKTEQRERKRERERKKKFYLFKNN
jgi:hypothetical protein